MTRRHGTLLSSDAGGHLARSRHSLPRSECRPGSPGATARHTVMVNGSEVLARKQLLPPYTPVTRYVPAASPPVRRSTATPFPFTAAVPSTTPPTLNVTLPIGAPANGARTAARIEPSAIRDTTTVGFAFATVRGSH